jgi:hypothetical protein
MELRQKEKTHLVFPAFEPRRIETPSPKEQQEGGKG